MELVFVNNRWIGQDNPTSYIILLIEEQKFHNDKFSESAASIYVKCNDGDHKRRGIVESETGTGLMTRAS